MRKPCQTPAGERQLRKVPQGSKLPLCWAKSPRNGGLQWGLEVRGLCGGLGWAHPRSHPTNREQTATQSTDKAGARTWAGTGSPWPGQAALGRERWLGVRSVFWLPWKRSAELMAAPQGCSALAQLLRSGTQGSATAKRRLQVKLCTEGWASPAPPAPPQHQPCSSRTRGLGDLGD